MIFGREKEGLSEEVCAHVPEELRIRIPMMPESRCLNLYANSVAVVAYEASLQLNYAGASSNPAQAKLNLLKCTLLCFV